MSQKFTSTIAGASIFISLIGVLSRGFGFIREMIFANNFGLETDFDLYLVGAVLVVSCGIYCIRAWRFRMKGRKGLYLVVFQEALRAQFGFFRLWHC